MSGELDATSAEARVTAAATERRDARRAAAAGAAAVSIRDVLAGLAERDERVVLGVGNGRSHRVRIAGVGVDAVLATTDTGATILVGIDAVSTVSTTWPGPIAAGSPVQPSWSMADIMAQWSSDRRRITARRANDQVTGQLVAAGLDVACVVTDAAGGAAYVRLDSTTEISVSDSSSL